MKFSLYIQLVQVGHRSRRGHLGNGSSLTTMLHLHDRSTGYTRPKLDNVGVLLLSDQPSLKLSDYCFCFFFFHSVAEMKLIFWHQNYKIKKGHKHVQLSFAFTELNKLFGLPPNFAEK